MQLMKQKNANLNYIAGLCTLQTEFSYVYDQEREPGKDCISCLILNS